MPRDHMRCYFGRADVQTCLASDRKPGDPFHIEAVLVDLALPRLRTDAFSGTRHDRGQMAPNNAFSWHLCGAYKTFTMANMAAQRDHLNRVTWEPLEAQVLHWGVALGPIYVVTGPIWTRFPEEEFDIFGLPLDDPDIECLIEGLRLVTPCTQRIDRLIDLLEQIRNGGRQGTGGSG